MSNQSVPNNASEGSEKNRDRNGWVKLTNEVGIISSEGALAALIVGCLLSQSLLDIRDEPDQMIYQAMRIVTRCLEGHLNDEFPQLPMDY